MQVRYAFVLGENDALQKLRDGVEENLIHKILKGSSGETTSKVDEDRPNKKEAYRWPLSICPSKECGAKLASSSSLG